MPAHRPQHRRIWLSLLIVAWGVQAIVTQSLLLREALVLMYGSEFAWGIVLFAWLAGTALGAIVGGRVSERVAHPDVGLVVVLTLLALMGCVELWMFRGARSWLGVGTGELLPLPKTALAGVLFVSPVSALVGLAFPLACRVPATAPDTTAARAGARSGGAPLLSLGSVYAMESIGSLVGGALFSFWAVTHLSPIQIALICAALTLVAGSAFTIARAGVRATAVTLATLTVAALVTAVFLSNTLHDGLVMRRWRTIAPDYELCAEADSPYQNIAIGRRETQYTLYTDGHVTSDFPDPYTFVPLAHLWMCEHPAPRRVLVLGGGAEGLLVEVLRHPVDEVVYVEPDPMIIDLIRPFIREQDRAALGDDRVTVYHGDARHFIKTQNARFDLVLARLPEPVSALHARLYTEGFYSELRRAMTEKAVFCLTAAATPGELTPASASYLGSLKATLNAVFAEVRVTWGDPAHLFAATVPGLTTVDAEELLRRYSERNVESGFFDPTWFEGATDLLDRSKMKRRAAELASATDVHKSSDLHPAIYLQRLVLWERMTGGAEHGVIEQLRRTRPWHVGVVLALAALATMVGYRWRATADRARTWLPRGVLALSVATTGLVTMALSIVWLFAFQNLYGYVYQRIGWIVALFMAGLVVGAGGAGRYVERQGVRSLRASTLWSALIVLDLLIALLASLAPVLLAALGSMPGGERALVITEICLSATVLVTGALGGAVFAVAGAIELGMTARPGAAAGAVVGADHVGACLGALLCGIVLVPVLGTVTTVALLAAIKLSSALLLFLARRPGTAA